MNRATRADVCTPPLDAMCAAASARVQQCILQAASAAYIALDIPPPDCHVIDVLLTIPGLAGIELTEPLAMHPCTAEDESPAPDASPVTPSVIRAWGQAFQGGRSMPILLADPQITGGL